MAGRVREEIVGRHFGLATPEQRRPELERLWQRVRRSPETVRTHIRNAMEHADAHTRAQLVARAISSGLISL